MTMENLQETLSLDTEKQKYFEKKIKAYRKEISENDGLVPGVIYLGHIPHGFYENEMKQYFSQFGKVTRLRLARSRKTGGSRGYAFIEFECDEVAKIVADTMNNYLMFEKLLKCEFVPPEKVEYDLFRGWKLGHPLAYVRSVRQQNKPKSEERQRANWSNRLQKLELVQRRLSELGFNLKLDVKLPNSELAKKALRAAKERRKLDKTKTPKAKVPSPTTEMEKLPSKYSPVTVDVKMLPFGISPRAKDDEFHPKNAIPGQKRKLPDSLTSKRKLKHSKSMPNLISAKRERVPSIIRNSVSNFVVTSKQAKRPARFSLTSNTPAQKSTQKKRFSDQHSMVKCDDSIVSQPSLFREAPNPNKASKYTYKGKTSTPVYARHFADDDDNSKHILEIDPSEEEITFKTPPNTVKVLKTKPRKPLAFIKVGNTKRMLYLAAADKEMKKRSRSLSNGWKVSSK